MMFARVTSLTNLNLTLHECLTQTFVISLKKDRDQFPPSLPTPEFFTPPNGVLKSRCSQVLTQTIPVSILLANS